MFKIRLFLLGLFCIAINAFGLDADKSRESYVNDICNECPEIKAAFDQLSPLVGTKSALDTALSLALFAKDEMIQKKPILSRAIEYADDIEKCYVTSIKATKGFKNGTFDELKVFVKQTADDIQKSEFLFEYGEDLHQILDKVSPQMADMIGDVVGISIACGIKHHRLLRARLS